MSDPESIMSSDITSNGRVVAMEGGDGGRAGRGVARCREPARILPCRQAVQFVMMWEVKGVSGRPGYRRGRAIIRLRVGRGECPVIRCKNSSLEGAWWAGAAEKNVRPPGLVRDGSGEKNVAPARDEGSDGS